MSFPEKRVHRKHIKKGNEKLCLSPESDVPMQGPTVTRAAIFVELINLFPEKRGHRNTAGKDEETCYYFKRAPLASNRT
jgi:hypothetical protein